MSNFRYFLYFLSINNSIHLEYKVTLLLLNLQNKSYIFSVVFVKKKVYFLIFKNGRNSPEVGVRVTKTER